MQYIVKDIIEEDFGCEGRPEGYVVKDTLILRDIECNEISVQVEDEEMIRKSIGIGDWVTFDLHGVIAKESES